MQFRLYVVLLTIAFVANLSLDTTDGEENPPPNILLIFPDQMRASAMGCAGNPDVQTPNIDRLAKEGTLFRRTYANVPVCCPARAILMTGTYPHVNGMMANDLRLRESQTTIAEILQSKGYRTGFIGKWHLDGGPRDPGFVPPGPRRQGFEFWAAYECHHKHFEPTYFRDTPQIIKKESFEPEASCDFAVEFLESQPKNQPFFLTVQMGPPHDPYGAPDEYMRRYTPERIHPPENWRPDSETRPETATKKNNAALMNRNVQPGGLEEIAAYYAAITAIDDQVGRLLKKLDEIGLDQNTIILFTSDHGDMLGSHGMRRKRKPHDESARIPGIVRWPKKIPGGQVVDTLFSHIDMPPTLLSLAGISVPNHMQGADLSQVALGHETQGPEAVLMQIFVPFNPDQIAEPWRGIKTDRFTYARFEDRAWVLFDDANDPYQLKNLVDDSEFASVRKSLDQKLQEMMSAKGDAWSFNSSQLVEEGGRLYRHETFYSIQDYLSWVDKNPEKATLDK